jgi:hypothetical protein
MMSVVYKKDSKSEEMTEPRVLNMLAYFSLFNYPLTKDEIANYMPPGTGDVTAVLDRLLVLGDVHQIQQFFSLSNDPSHIDRRIDGNQRAAKLLPKAMRIGRFLSRFPFVRGIAISGSLSKNFADDKADIDFFIVTKRNRLWLARTFMHLFKKLTFLSGKQHFYCMNYYIDEQALLIGNQNIYTAIETATLVPVSGTGMNDFFNANRWVNDWFMGYDAGSKSVRTKSRSFILKSFLEWVFNNGIGESLDNFLMRLTTQRWQKKKSRRQKTDQGKEMDLVTGKHFARSNPGMFQEKLLARYEARIRELRKGVIRDF